MGVNTFELQCIKKHRVVYIFNYMYACTHFGRFNVVIRK